MRSLCRKARQSDVQIGALARKLFNAITKGLTAGIGDREKIDENSLYIRVYSLEEFGLPEELAKFDGIELIFNISLIPRRKGSYSRGGQYVTRPFQGIHMNIEFSQGDFANIDELFNKYSIGQVLNIPFIRDAFVHELVHFVSDEQYKLWGKIKKPKGDEKYYNFPFEILAYIHQFTTTVLAAHNDPKVVDQLSSPRYFIDQVFDVAKKDHPEFLEHLNSDNLKRIKKWLYTYHADAVIPFIKKIKEGGSMQKLKQAGLILKGQAEILTFEQALAEIEQMAKTSEIALYQLEPTAFEKQQGRIIAFGEVLEILRKVK